MHTDVSDLVNPDLLSSLVGEPRVAGALLVAVAAVVALVAVVSLVRRDRARYGPTFRRLCRALRVGGADRRRVSDLARALGAPAASLLVSRGCFDAAVVAARIPRGRAKRVDALRKRVFG